MCLKYFLDNNIDMIINGIASNDLISKLREERNVFIKNTFPIGVQNVIDMCLKHKLNKINKNNQAIIDDIVNSPHRCMLSYCNGTLNDDFKCSKCDTQFCKDCERKKNVDHVCKESDLESMKFMGTIGKCPSCKIPIEKSQGCRSMKCASCGTMFDYYTGIKSDHGGSNDSVTLKESVKLSYMYRGIYDENIIRRLQSFEYRLPNHNDEKKLGRIIKVVTEYVNNGKNDADVYASRVAELYNDYVISKDRYRNYMQKISEIEDLNESGDLTMENLSKII